MNIQKVSGNIVDVVGKKIYSGTIHISEGNILKIVQENVTSQDYIIPGFIDAHVHVESSMLIPSEFARLAVCHGTVATISDPHEIANVLGVDGVKYMISNASKTPFKFHFGAPSCVPATKFETAGAEITVNDVKNLLNLPDIHYLTEMMNFPGVLFGDPEVLAKIKAAKDVGKPVDGHAPGLIGEDVKKYASAGITTDHECFTKEEALGKLKHGMKILIREGSAAKNFDELISLLDEYPNKIMFCSDDKHPNDLVEGHINTLAKRAVSKGCDVMNVLRATSYNVVKHYNMNVGLLQENDAADFCVVSNLKDFEVLKTYINGKLVAEQNASILNTVKEKVVNNFNCSPIKELQIKIKSNTNEVKVIAVEDGQLITKKGLAKLASENDYLKSDVTQDVLKIVVVNRYFDAPPAIAFVKNFGLQKGALASCVAHDSHNIIAIGVDDVDIVNAINIIIENKGGISLVNEKEKLILPLPVAGIMSEKDGYQVADSYDRIDLRAKELGVQLKAPYMTLSFCALLVIPSLKLSDKGLFDGDKFEFTSLTP